MRSLVLTRFRPDQPNGGAALRNWQNIQALSQLGPVDVLSISETSAGGAVDGVREWASFAPDPILAGRRPWRWRQHDLLRPAHHAALDGHLSEPAARWLEQRVRANTYDTVVIEELALAPYLPVARAGGTRVVFDAHNVEALLRQSMTAAREHDQSWRARLRRVVSATRLQIAERAAVTRADLVWACSDLDAAALQQAYRPAAPIAVVPNGVDVDAYSQWRNDPPVGESASSWSTSPLTLMYLGAFSYYPNEDAALQLIQEVLPQVRARGHTARVILVGRDPTPALLQAAAADESVTVTGAVSSVLPFLAQPAIVTLPIRLGSGTRLKIVEAFAAGRPVISTRKGAEGITARDGEHLLLRESAAEMAEAAVQLWSSAPLRQLICENAFQLVQRDYSWRESSRRIVASLRAIHLSDRLSLAGRDATPPSASSSSPSP